MTGLKPKLLPPPSITTLYPPIHGYQYFSDADRLPFEPGGGPQSAINHWWLAEHGLLAYEEDAVVERTLAQHGYRVHIVHDASTGTEAYAAVKDTHGILAFRGTEVILPGDSAQKIASVLRDWLTDSNFSHTRFEQAGWVHAGFAKAFNSIWESLVELSKEAEHWWCTGHSLGAALASLAAVRLNQHGCKLSGLVTYGQPRCGDRDFAQALNQLPYVRVVNGCDLVPRMPPEAFGYQHGGTLVHFDAQKLDDYGATLRNHLLDLPNQLKHGWGALTPVELIDHAPLYYAIKCFNAAILTA